MRRLLSLLRSKRIRTLSSREAYARWAADYPPIPHNRFMELEQATLLEMMPPLAGKRVLDLACGSGRWGRLALEQGARQVISLDDSRPMLERGQPPLAIEGSMAAIPLAEACVEVVICGLAVGHLPPSAMQRTFSEIGRVLLPGGVALLSDVHPLVMWTGGRRTFQSQGQTYAVEHYIHSYADYHTAAQACGLRVTVVKEVAAQAGQMPVLLAMRLEKSLNGAA
jgi:malonyl-CoA O-methyltransferase